MGTELRIRRVSLEHADPEHSWRFADGVTVIVGASGGSKSSLLHLIHYGLGMNDDLVEEIPEHPRGHPRHRRGRALTAAHPALYP